MTIKMEAVNQLEIALRTIVYRQQARILIVWSAAGILDVMFVEIGLGEADVGCKG